LSDDWIEIADENISVEEIMRRIQKRVAQRGDVSTSDKEEMPEDVAQDLWREVIGDVGEESAYYRQVPIRQRDCDIVPRHYVIDWRIPILGPVHTVVRRVINAEIRRYLLPSLKKQSSFNRRVVQALKHLTQENARLRQEIEELGAGLK
jgi:hypothetical protein